MKLTFFGATKTTTGSRFLFEVNGSHVLLECGMYQGKRSESMDRNSRLEFDAATVNAMALSHAHIDHSGVIPVLTKSGYQGKIHCTAPTHDLCSIMLIDCAHIQEQDAEYITRKNAKKGLPPVEPIYRQDDARKALDHFSPVKYNEPTPIANGVTATWLDAGHLLGSASVVLDIEEKGRRIRFGFSGDVGRPNNDLLPNPTPMSDLDYLMVESTYGNREHEDLKNVNQRVCGIINRAVERKGKIIIPAFAVSRVQQLLYTLAQIIETNCIPSIPIYVDSPLAVDATEIFEKHFECFNPKFKQWLRRNGNPFARMNVTYIRDVEESKKLNDLLEPCIIMSASGMAEAGRIRHHIKNNITDDRNTILIVGYCPPDTLGGRLVARVPEVSIFGEPYKVKAHIEVIDAFSGHADRSELCDYVQKTTGKLKTCFVVHGEEDQAKAMAEHVRRIKPSTNVVIPNYRDSVEL
jgi:metallo-beta-lactamase family protein